MSLQVYNICSHTTFVILLRVGYRLVTVTRVTIVFFMFKVKDMFRVRLSSHSCLKQINYQ